jgi:hypothetical protein
MLPAGNVTVTGLSDARNMQVHELSGIKRLAFSGGDSTSNNGKINAN